MGKFKHPASNFALTCVIRLLFHGMAFNRGSCALAWPNPVEHPYGGQTMNWRKLNTLQRVILGLSALYAGVFILMLIARPGSKDFYHGFFNTYQAIPPFFASLYCFWLFAKGKIKNKVHRAGWLLIGLGCLSFFAGQATWTVIETVMGQEVPFPGWPDAGYLGSYLFLLPGVVLLMTSSHMAGRARLFLDSAIAASAFGFFSWHFIIEKIWADAEQSAVGKLISAGYPLGDFAILFAAIVAMSSSSGNRNMRRSLVMVGIGTILIAFSDTVFLYMTNNGNYETGSWADWGWSFGYLTMGFAALARLWWPLKTVSNSETSLRQKPWVAFTRIIAPYAAVVLSLGFIIGDDIVKNGVISPSVYVQALVIFFLIIARQIFVIMENFSLNRKMNALNENLEQIVERRTEQLSALQQLTKAVNGTLSVEKVLSEAAGHTLKALRADGVVIWLSEEQALTGETDSKLAWEQGLEDHPDVMDFLAQQTFGRSPQMMSLPFDPKSVKEQWVFLSAPLNWHLETVGTIGVLRHSGTFAEGDFDLLESIGIEVGTAIEHARQHSAALAAADRDPVTNLLNHRAIHQRLDVAFRRSVTLNKPLSVMMTDMNNFKLFNDTYGHFVGDQVLKEVAKALTEECRSTDILGRFGGDEFLVVMPDTDLADAHEVAERVQKRLNEAGFCKGQDERTIPVSLSFGLGAYPVDGSSRHEVLTIADANMYHAKGSDSGIVRSSDTQQENRELKAESSFEILDALVTAVDNKDRYTRKHSEDVTEYALWISEELGLSEESMRVIRIAGLLHDVGKIGVPDDILRKPGRLTPEEYEVMKRHPRLGELIVSAIPGMESIVDAVRSHHERWDGQGYPDQLAADNIPFLGRLLAVPDAFSAMTTDRPYRKGMDWTVAVEEIRANIGTQFDPEIAQAFITAVQKRRTLELIEGEEATAERKKAA